MKKLPLFVALMVLVCAHSYPCFAADGGAGPAAPNGNIEFNRDVRPVLSDKCFACHGFDAKRRKAKLRLDVADGATTDRENGPAVSPGKLDKSQLWERINSKDPDQVMPPPESNKTISDKEKQVLRRWIEQGAKYQMHWSLEPIGKPQVPHPASSSGAANASVNPVDAFLVARLEKEGLKPGPEADRATLVRRAAFALTGLPPTPAEVDAFVNDPKGDAYERTVDRYMASPRFGEEMARYWLDVVRYADTHGLHLDNERQMWAYRDWVIAAFNNNEPFDRFTVEQVAGDLLPDARHPNPTKQQLTATGFNRCNVTSSEGGSIDAEYLYRYAVDRTSTVVSTWLGMTGGCAVCHDHKFDPISTKEFYSIYAFFNSAADPAMDGNALLTNPTARVSTPEQDKQLAELTADYESKQKVLGEKASSLSYADPAAVEPRPAPEVLETVWLDDNFPPGAQVRASPGEPTHWVTAAEGGHVYSGNRALMRTDKGLAQDFYESGAAPLVVPPDAQLFAYVYLDSKNPPKSIMLQYHTGQWMHRAVWGDYDAIQFGAAGTTEKVNMGSLPDTGKWLRLEVPAEKVGLKPGDRISGFALTQFGGTVFWDKVGIVARIDAAADPARSLLAWWKSNAGKDIPDVPPQIGKLLKEGPDKVKAPEELKRLRDFYLGNVCAETRAQIGSLAEEVAAAKGKRDKFETELPSTFVFTNTPTPRDSFVMLRGQYDKPGEKVEPGTPAFLPPLKKADPAGRATRLDLANWLVAPGNPLTARVTVNRFWQQFLGVGLVKTGGDFGSQGEPPSHPELLDRLACDFRDGGWDVKALVRLLVTSQAFRRSSVVSPELEARDPENRLLARGPRFRLDAEQIRDNALYVSGLLNEQRGVRARMYQPSNIWEPVGFVGSNTRFYRQDSGPALYRRSIYCFLKRTAPPPFMANFDAPNREQTCTRRERSDTPLQALQLMNDVQHVEAARCLAERMLTEGGHSGEERIRFAYKLVLSREPDAEEKAVLGEQLAAHLKRYKEDGGAAKALVSQGESKPKAELQADELAAYTLVASTVLNLDETLNRN